MDDIVNKIINLNKSLFGDNPSYEKINVGFTNTIYNVNNKYIIKICTDINNEDSFKNEINFYEKNINNMFIPKLYVFSIDKKDINYYYEIIEKVEGTNLYNLWHTFNNEQREGIIKQLCDALKIIHSNICEKYNWIEKNKKDFWDAYNKILKLNIFDSNDQIIINNAFNNFDKYLDTDEFVLVHNDIHFDNIIYNNGIIKLIDFERSMYAPRDFELDIIYRMIRKPWKFASEEAEPYTKLEDYSNIINYIEKYYKELFDTPNLYERLAIYDMVYFMNQLIEYPHLNELKQDVLDAAKKLQ